MNSLKSRDLLCEAMRGIARKTIGMKVMLLGLVAMALFPVATEAGFITVSVGQLSDPGKQTINFSPANSGVTVIGNTNPPSPFYDVTATSLESLTLHGSGSTVDTGVDGPGFLDILLTPAAPFAWTAVDFQLDSSLKLAQTNSNTLTITATFFGGGSYSASIPFPGENDNGENQHYLVQAGLGDLMTSLEIRYIPPTGSGDTISDIHNIDVMSVNTVPEPSAIAMWSITAVIGAFGGLRNRLKRCKTAA